MKRARKTSLPRITLLAYSRQDLLRFSERMEKMAASVLALTDLVARLQEQVERLERRATWGKKAYKAAGGKTE